MESIVTVSRVVACGGYAITETASAALPDDLTLDPEREARRRYQLAHFLFQSLPQIQPKPKSPPPCPPPTSPNSRN